jgi:polyhydroxyalkanoate synthesis repressor PhaR
MARFGRIGFLHGCGFFAEWRFAYGLSHRRAAHKAACFCSDGYGGVSTAQLPDCAAGMTPFPRSTRAQRRYMTTTTKKTAERLIKKYPNRRLYDTETSTYITLTDVKQLVLDQEDFKVIDAKSNEDLTRAILLQIILDEESGGLPMFSSSMLSQIIRFYGHAMQGMMGTYLEKNIQAFIDIQAKLADQSKNLYEGKAMNPEVWSQFMNMQAPMMQGMMTSYIEQSKNMFVQMQEQMQSQAKSMFATFPFTPGGPVNAAGAPATPANPQNNPEPEKK